MTTIRRFTCAAILRASPLAIAILLFAVTASAQEELDDFLSDLGSAEVVEQEEAPATLREGAGSVAGRVIDGQSGVGVSGATVVLEWAGDGAGESREQVTVTNSEGGYEFRTVAAGMYRISFVKSGYRAARIQGFEVVAGQRNAASFPIEPLPATGSGEVLDLEAFVVEASTVADLMTGLEMRLDSDQFLNIMTAEDLSRFASSDVADALKRVAGVNVVEGQFAIIRGLEDRYSSTLFNGATVPSPDPDRQSVQLDLFPADVVTNLVVTKTFSPGTPSNSSGGSIDIITADYPETFEIKTSLGSGFEEGALEEFLKLKKGSPVGEPVDNDDVIETDFGGSIGGRYSIFDREIRFKGLVNNEIDYRTYQGTQSAREPSRREVYQSGGLGLGELALSDGYFEQTVSARTEQLTGYAALGLDLDEDGDHRVDATFFYTKKKEESVDLRENGFFPDLDYSPLVEATENGDLENNILRNTYRAVATPGSRLAGTALRDQPTDQPTRGALWFANFGRSSSFQRNRDLFVYQLNGNHDFDVLEGLHIRWAANRAKTTQSDHSLGMRFFYEPCGYSGQFRCPSDVTRIPVPTQFPVAVEDLGVGNYFASGQSGGIVDSANDIHESQWFVRLDAEQDIAFRDFVQLNLAAGGWWEDSKRSVESMFLETVTVNGRSQWALDSPTLEELGGGLFDRFDELRGERFSTNDSSREITAAHGSLKATFWEDLDVMAGVRFEKIFIDSRNEPFTGEIQFARPATFPTAYLFFDRLDNPDPRQGGEVPFADPARTFNDQVLGIDVPTGDSGFVDLLTEEEIAGVVNGEIDRFEWLPALGITYRPLVGLALKTAYSQTIARPSFREIGYYVSVEPGTDERTVGNPQLGLSKVESYDFRAEYVYGDLGDLFAFSAFYKKIDDPIESAVVRNPVDLDSGSAALFRTFFNNPNQATLWGIEVEARKSFDFLRKLGLDFPGIEALDYLSIGGNYTYIDAKVNRTEFELERASDFFEVNAPDVARFDGLETSRRLFGQPKWIANADLSFRHPDWGTTLTLAFFAISDVLDAAGTTAFGPFKSVSNTLDRYVDSFYQLDLVASQKIWRGLSVKMSVKNLTNSVRRRTYDEKQLEQTVAERSGRVGRDWSFSVGYTHEF